MKDNAGVGFSDEEYSLEGKYILLYSENCEEISLGAYVRGSTRSTAVPQGTPPEMILSFSYMPNKYVGISLGGGINTLLWSEHGRARGVVFLQNDLYYFRFVGETGGASGYYWSGQLILKVVPYFNVGFMAERNEVRSPNPEDGFGPRIEINVLGTPLTFSGGAIFPWKVTPIETQKVGAYIGATASF